ncbi:MAG TPA: LysR substrate-binding domain-containing protein [Steroidobacteraceae bacterium]|nr:LysR substrate-binding domain-containing protein [Steroidobacteraceae bacterium]
MHLSRVDLNLLVVFDTVLNAGGVTAASRKLNLSQPAVSHAIARLRAVFGDRLFERQGRTMVPTPFARSIAGPVRTALDTLERTLDTAGGFDPLSSERTFRIGVRDMLERRLLPPLLTEVSRAAPHVDLVSARLERRRLEQDLLSGRLDLAVDVLLPMSPRVRHERLLHDRLVVVARRRHPALRRLRGAGWDLPTYLAQEHIQVSGRRSGPGLEDMALRSLGQSRRIRLRCQSHGAACEVASRTDLIATIPESCAVDAVLAGAVRAQPLAVEGLALETYLYWSEAADRDPATTWLRERLVRAASAPSGLG